MELENITLRIINIYAPNTDTPNFFQTIDNLISENTSGSVFTKILRILLKKTTILRKILRICLILRIRISVNTGPDHLILCGDFNLIFDPNMDCYNYVSINNPRSVIWVSMRIHELIDTFPYFHPNTKRYTWRRRNTVKQAQLNYYSVPLLY